MIQQIKTLKTAIAKLDIEYPCGLVNICRVVFCDVPGDETPDTEHLLQPI